MNPSFTPRSTSRPTQSEPAVPHHKPAGAQPSLWSRVKPALHTAIRVVVRSLIALSAWTVRYIRRLSRRQRWQHAGVLLGVLICVFAFIIISSRRPAGTAQNPTTTHSTTELPKETPGFDTLLPAGKTAEDFGGWTRVSPSDRNPVYAYADTVGGVSISVSQQPIPDSFKSDLAGSVEQLSESYSASRTFQAGSIMVHIGKSAKGPQSLIFTKGDLLVLIKSASTISDDDWKTYIASLR